MATPVPNLFHRIIFRLPLLLPIAYMAVIYALSSIPGKGELEGLAKIALWVPPQIQNFLHIPLYAGLTLLWFWVLSLWIGHRQVIFAVAFLLTAAYGVVDEFHQLHVPGRYASLTDIALNMLGAGLAIAWAVVRNMHPSKVT
jgi:VanZ family protein